MLSERMREWAKDSWEPNSGITAEELEKMDNQSVLIFAEEVTVLESRIKELLARLAKLKRDNPLL